MLVDLPRGTIEVRVGCGVRIQVPGTRWKVNAEVLALDEAAQTVKVQGADFEGWIPKVQITNVISPGDYVLDNAINIIGGGDFPEE